VKAFVGDFVRGASEEDLQDKFSLTSSQLPRVVSILKRRGDLTPDEIARREQNLKVPLRSEGTSNKAVGTGKVAVDLDTGLVLHCPSCAAAVKRDAEKCDYCGSHLDFSLQGKTTHCPHCFQRIPADSKFCVACAGPVQVSLDDGKELQDRFCPRCAVNLISRRIGEFSVMACDSCSGMFIPHDTFEIMQRRADTVVSRSERLEHGSMKFEKSFSYIKCPVCQTMMNRKNFAGISAVIVDICGRHGIWFDGGEMEKIMDFITRGGLQEARVRDETERLKEQAALLKIRTEDALARGVDPALLGSTHLDGHDGMDLLDLMGEVFHLLRK
jgi:Zn-finger nucleic acid-binding protein